MDWLLVSLRPALRRALALAGLIAVVGSGCAHGVSIASDPPGAKVYVDDEEVGTSPLTVQREPGFFGGQRVRLELDGHTPVETELVRAEPIWPIVAPAVCLAPPTLGLSCLLLRWGFKYADQYTFTLREVRTDGSSEPLPPSPDQPEDERAKDDARTLPY